MPARGHAGPPHIQHPKLAFNALDMFKQVTTLTTPSAGVDTMIYENADIMIYENSDVMVYE